MSERALSGVTVLDLSQYITGPYCTRLLADYGADVIKIEQPGSGDVGRHRGPFFHDQPTPDASGPFLHLNANKRSITLNLKTASGRRILRRLVAEADILVESFPPATASSLGLDYSELRSLNPALVMASISNFGQEGPYRDYKSSEIITYAMGGPMYATGLAEREPVKLGANVIQHHAGASCAAATMIALTQAEQTGLGDHLDFSLMRAQAANMDRRTTMFVGFQHTKEVNRRLSIGSAPGAGVSPSADGYFAMSGDGARFHLTAKMIGHPELLEDPRFQDDTARAQPGRREEFEEYFLPWALSYTKREIFQQAQAQHIPSAPINDAADLLAEPVFHERGFWSTIDHPVGRVVDTGRPFIMNRTPWEIRRPAPLLGEHNREVLGGLLGMSAPELASLRESGVI